MAVYRMAPVLGWPVADTSWGRTGVQVPCWVDAADEYEARNRVANARLIMVATDGPPPVAPWRDARMTTCELDPSKEVPPGIIICDDVEQTHIVG